MTRLLPRACLIMNVISRHENWLFQGSYVRIGVEGRAYLRAGYLLFYGTSGVGRWVSCLSERKHFLLIFVLL